MVMTAEQLLKENQRRIRGVRNISTNIRKYNMARELSENYIVLNFETTGLRPGADKIIQIGAIKYHQYKETETYRSLINPRRHIPIEVTRRTKITHFLVEDAPFIEDEIENLLSFIGELPVVTHNPSIHMNFLYAIEQTENIHLPSLNVIDTARLARKTLSIISNEKLEELTTYLLRECERKDVIYSCNTINNIYQFCTKELR